MIFPNLMVFIDTLFETLSFTGLQSLEEQLSKIAKSMV